MKVCISWFHPESKKLAHSLSHWLAILFDSEQTNTVFSVAEKQSAPDSTWLDPPSEITEADIIILCFTSGIYEHLWGAYEAGIFSTSGKKQNIVPFLIEGADLDLLGPINYLEPLTTSTQGLESLVSRIQIALNDSGGSESQNMLPQQLDSHLNDIAEELKRLETSADFGATDFYYLASTRRFGIGHNKVLFSCEMFDDGSAAINREVEVEAFSIYLGMPTFLMATSENTVPSGLTPFPHPEITSTSNSPQIKLEHVRIQNVEASEILLEEQESEHNNISEVKPYRRTLGDLAFRPPLKSGDKVLYKMRESVPPGTYLDPTDMFGWVVHQPTKRLELRVRLPKGYEPAKIEPYVTSATALGFPTRHETAERNRLAEPFSLRLADGRYEIGIGIDHPMTGMTYRLRWNYRDSSRSNKFSNRMWNLGLTRTKK